MGYTPAFLKVPSFLQKSPSNIVESLIFHCVASVGISIASLRLAGEGEGCDGPASGMPQPPLRTPFTGTFRKE
jgi:hypothetical protein